MLDLFNHLPTIQAPPRAKLSKPKVAPVAFGSGFCNAACMFAIGPDCDCPCNGRNHQAGFRCNGFSQEEIGI